LTEERLIGHGRFAASFACFLSVDRYAIHRVRPDVVVMQGRVVHGRLP
jgi:hypothetical protein